MTTSPTAKRTKDDNKEGERLLLLIKEKADKENMSVNAYLESRNLTNGDRQNIARFSPTLRKAVEVFMAIEATPQEIIWVLLGIREIKEDNSDVLRAFQLIADNARIILDASCRFTGSDETMPAN